MDDIKKIVITGPESSGKTTLAKALSAYFGDPWVPEYARTYIDQLDRPYQEEDLVHIAHGQLHQEHLLSQTAKQFLFCDTDLLTIKVWSAVKYQRIKKYILEQIELSQYDLYVLCKPDIPWEPDPQREAPDVAQREFLYDLYKNELLLYRKTFIEIEGSRKERLQKAIFHISSLIT